MLPHRECHPLACRSRPLLIYSALLIKNFVSDECQLRRLCAVDLPNQLLRPLLLQRLSVRLPLFLGMLLLSLRTPPTSDGNKRRSDKERLPLPTFPKEYLSYG